MSKKKTDIGQFVTTIVAFILVAYVIFGMCGALNQNGQLVGALACAAVGFMWAMSRVFDTILDFFTPETEDATNKPS